MRRALTFIAITGLSLASRHHSETRKPVLPEDNKPVQVSHGAFDDELRLIERPRPGTYEPYINRPTQVSHGAFDDELRLIERPRPGTYEPYINRPTQVSHGAFDDDNELRILFNPENPKPILQIPFYELNKPTQVSHGAFDDELRVLERPRPGTHEPYVNRPIQVSHGAFDDELSAVLGQVVKTPYLENQKKFQHIQFPNPIVQEGKPVQVPFGALDDEMRLLFNTERPSIHEPYINRPVQVSHGAFDDELHNIKVKTQQPTLESKRSFRPVPQNYLENQKKFQHIQFPNPIVQEGKPVEVPYGAL